MKQIVVLPASMALALLAGTVNAPGAVLFDYLSASSTTSATITATHVAEGLSATPLSAGTGLTANTGSTYNWRDWSATDAAGALAAGDSFTWGFSVGSTAPTISLTGLGIRYDRSSTGPVNVEIAYAIGAGAFNTIFTDGSVSENGEENTISLSSITALQNLAIGSTVTFRLLGWGASSTLGTFDLENSANFNNAAIVVYGTVPEPTAAVIGSLGLLGLLRRRR